jgi:hypothetical protein
MTTVYHQPSSSDKNKTSNEFQFQPESIQLDPTQSIDEIESYRCWSVFNALCCCLCLGIAAFIYSGKAKDFKKQGNFQEASKASRKARKLNIIGTILGIILIPVFIIAELQKLQTT